MGGCLERQYEAPKAIDSKLWDGFLAGIPSGALNGKVVVITGCSSGLGKVLAEACGAKGATVVMVNRASDRASKAFDQVRAKLGDRVINIEGDMASFKSVRNAAQQMNSQFASTGIDVLANNAGIMAFPDKATEDGCDIQMQTNHLGHFLLTKELYPLLQKAAETRGEARIVHQTSIGAITTGAMGADTGPLKPEYLGKNGGNLGGDADNGPMKMDGPTWDRYGQSKLANIVFTMALKDKLAAASSKIKAVVAHPGISASNLQVTAVGQGGMSGLTASMAVSQSAEDGTMGIMQCVAGPVTSGDIWGPGGTGMAGEIQNLTSVWGARPAISDQDGRTMLWVESEKSTGCKFDI